MVGERVCWRVLNHGNENVSEANRVKAKLKSTHLAQESPAPWLDATLTPEFCKLAAASLLDSITETLDRTEKIVS